MAADANRRGMVLYAIDDLDDAMAATRALLSPIRWRPWLTLAFVVFFVGGVGGAPSVPNVPSGGDADPGAVPTPEIGPELVVLLAAAVLALSAVAVVFGLVGAIMEFVLVESLREAAVAVRRHWAAHWRRGLRLFGFRLGLGVFGLAAVLVLAAVVVLPGVAGEPTLSIASLLAVLPVAVVLFLGLGLVGGFTTVFVVPIMIVEDCGVLAGWRRLWPTLRRQWRQFLAYAVAGLVLSIAGGILVGLGTLIATVALLIPFGLAGLATYAVYSAAPTAGLAIGALIGIAFVVSLLTAVALLKVPVVVFLRYYALFVLGDANEALDPIPDRRAAVRD